MEEYRFRGSYEVIPPILFIIHSYIYKHVKDEH